MLWGNDQRLQSGFNFSPPTLWDAPSSVYEIPLINTNRKIEQRRWPGLHALSHRPKTLQNTSHPPSWIFKKSMTSQSGKNYFLEETIGKYF